MAAQLSLHDVTKTFGDVKAVNRVSLDVQQGEFLTLLGPSGSGKTTTLNMIAGFEIPTSGQILLKDRDITSVAPNNRGIGMVFQNYALFPHMTVFDNIAFPLKMRKVPRQEIRERTEEVLELVELPGFEKRYPNQLSGGQQQRIALARALVFRPDILLMDEPLGALDKKLRDHMKLEIKHLQESLHITVIYVTHDQEEALTMSDRIAIMNNGQIVQLDNPAELYEAPASLFVADFIGESNFLEGNISEIDKEKACVEVTQDIKVWVEKLPDLQLGKKLTVAVRPEKIQVFPDKNGPGERIINFFPGQVEEVIYVGEANVYRVRLHSDVVLKVKVQSAGTMHRYRRGDKVVVGWHVPHGLPLK
ncbi:MAG: polyamine ABC transporter ATP-binding protein [Thermoplasmata archaeon]|nr:MAG: polyamine ABC transporter ATP-binding protein [Thermoplasmata archaeon]